MPDRMKLLFLFHGYGSDGKDMEPIASYISSKLLDIKSITPNGYDICDINPHGFQWFALSDTHRYEYTDILEDLCLKVEKDLINKELNRYSLTMEDVILAGFSQGAMLALALALKMKDKPLAVISFSGLLMNGIVPQGKTKSEILLLHGCDDEIIPIKYYENTINKLNDKNIKFSARKYQGLGHSINIQELECAIDFLRRVV